MYHDFGLYIYASFIFQRVKNTSILGHGALVLNGIKYIRIKGSKRNKRIHTIPGVIPVNVDVSPVITKYAQGLVISQVYPFHDLHTYIYTYIYYITKKP